MKPDTHASLRAAAGAVLRANDLGGWTRPAPRLYPHQWSWDSAFIALGLAQLDPSRALLELESLFAAQWADGRVPQIVYNPAAPPEGYFPDAARWACAELNPAAPRQPATSGLCQPPVHALAAWRIVTRAPDAEALRPRLLALWPRLLAWHRYLAVARDSERSGLITVYHPWESGTDNSPRWDAPLDRVQVGPVPPYVRRDLQHVAEASHRPTNAEYDRYLWLVETLKQARYHDPTVRQRHPFLVKDVLVSAILAAASRALGQLAAWLDLPAAVQREIASQTSLVAEAVQARAAGTDRWGNGCLVSGSSFLVRDEDELRVAGFGFREGEAGRDPRTGRQEVGVDEGQDREELERPGVLALDVDLLVGRPIPAETFAGFAPLLTPGAQPALVEALERALLSERWLGHPGLAYRVLPSTSPASAAFRPRTYWRGPCWPVANWLVWHGLVSQGRTTTAAALRAANLVLLARPAARFAEYFDPLTAESLGSADQSWSAAVALDWLGD